MSEQAAAKAGFLSGLTGLHKLTLAIAGAVSLAGAGLWAYGATVAPARGPAQVQEGDGQGADSGGEDQIPFAPQGFTDDTTSRPSGAKDDAAPAALEKYAPTVFRIGFAFFIGFAVAFAVRAALKVVLIVVGVVLLLLVGLQMAGIISVNWSALDGVYAGATGWLGEQTESLSAFVRGYIPSGGTALAGFGVGMTRKH